MKTLVLKPGSPWKNGYEEFFNGELRDELLARALIDILRETKVLIERRQKAYCTVGPHSSLRYRSPAPETRRVFCSLRLRLSKRNGASPWQDNPDDGQYRRQWG